MTYIKTVKPEEAEGIVKEEYDKGIRRAGEIGDVYYFC
jgi:hypothetical protein